MDSLSALTDGNRRLVAFTGKGGVGKTTCSAATAIRYADVGENTLLLSTDRSPSLSDVLETDVYGEITSVPDVPHLDAVEMDYDAIAEQWKERYGEEIYAVVSSFMPVDRWVIDYFAEAPGIATQFALSYLLEYYHGDTYDRIVWDTAPAGSTIGLVELEEKLYGHLGEAPKFYAKLRAAVKRDVTHDPGALIEDWRQLAHECLEMVRAEDTTFVVVTIPETLGVKETERVLAELESRELVVAAVVANNVLTESVCDCDYHRRRVAMQETHLAELENRYGEDPGLVTVPQLPTEVSGIESLRTVGTLLFDEETTSADVAPVETD